MFLEHVFFGVAWIIYCIMHSVLATQQAKKMFYQRVRMSASTYRILYNIFSALLLFALIGWQLRMMSPFVFESNFIIELFGLIMCVSGLIIMGICIRKYFLNLSGLKNEEAGRVDNELKVEGIHKFVRHPLYLGTFCAIWGFFLYIPHLNFLIENVVITVYTVIAIRYEEAKLIEEFGIAYQRYRREVPMILPFSRKKSA